ncbi:uncharacterized Na(+)/H(+) exchanger Mb2309, partial [Arthrobacter sp. Hiyo6]
YTPVTIAGLFALSYMGGAAAGILVAGAAYLLLIRVREPLIINIALLITPFTAFLLAEAVGASGVLAVVAAGLIISFTSNRISTAASRRQTESAWPLGSYLLNGALFVLIGVQVQAAVHEITPAMWAAFCCPLLPCGWCSSSSGSCSKPSASLSSGFWTGAPPNANAG